MESLHPCQTDFILDGLYDILVRVGLHCAPQCMNKTFPAGTDRASVGYFNTLKDVEALMWAVRQICRVKG